MSKNITKNMAMEQKGKKDGNIPLTNITSPQMDKVLPATESVFMWCEICQDCLGLRKSFSQEIR